MGGKTAGRAGCPCTHSIPGVLLGAAQRWWYLTWIRFSDRFLGLALQLDGR